MQQALKNSILKKMVKELHTADEVAKNSGLFEPSKLGNNAATKQGGYLGLNFSEAAVQQAK